MKKIITLSSRISKLIHRSGYFLSTLVAGILVTACMPAPEQEDTPRPPPPVQRVEPGATPIVGDSVAGGQRLSTEDYRGQFVLLDFWAPWSAPSMAERSDVIALHEDFGSDSFTVLSVVLDVGDAATISATLDELALPFPVLRAAPSVLQAYGGGRAVPTKILLDTAGRIIETYPGAVSLDRIREDIDELLAAQ